MSSEKDSLVQRVESSYLKLTSVASDLNSASDELGKSISELDFALKKLNLGITVWTDIRVTHSDDGELYWSEELGYGKIGGKWGISLRTVKGWNNPFDEDEIEQWLFNDAPRSLRLSAIKKIPEILEKLSTAASETATKIRAQLGEAQELAAVVKRASESPAPGKAVSAKLTIEVTAATGKTANEALMLSVLSTGIVVPGSFVAADLPKIEKPKIWTKVPVVGEAKK